MGGDNKWKTKSIPNEVHDRRRVRSYRQGVRESFLEGEGELHEVHSYRGYGVLVVLIFDFPLK